MNVITNWLTNTWSRIRGRPRAAIFVAVAISIIAVVAAIAVNAAAPNASERATVLASPMAVATTSPQPAVPNANCDAEPAKPLPSGSTPFVSIDSVSAGVGDNALATLVLSDAATGLAGYAAEVTLSNPDIAQITDVTFADLELSRVISNTGAKVTFAAADLSQIAEPGATNIPLAVLTLSAVSPGLTDMEIRILRVDDDSGSTFEVQALSGSLKVC